MELGQKVKVDAKVVSYKGHKDGVMGRWVERNELSELLEGLIVEKQK